MNRKNKSNKERLEKLRVARRIKYAEIKQDPELYMLQKEKEKKRYQVRKEKKQIKSVQEKSPRQQREQRKKWREAAKKYRAKKKAQDKENPVTPEVVVINTSNVSEDRDSKEDKEKPKDPLNESSPIISAKIRKIRYLEQKKRNRLLTIIKNLREENKELKLKLCNLTKKDKQNENKKKDNILTKNSKPKTLTENTRIKKLVKKVREFYLDESNSTIMAGKKQYITRLKLQKQKRYMRTTQKALHQKFMEKYQVRVSYTFFCKHKPFWVLKPKTNQRDTTMCQVHDNTNLMIEAFKKASVINEQSTEELLKNLCCSVYDEKCLKRECQSCKGRSIHINEFSNEKDIEYNKWVRAREKVKSKKGQKVITVTKKNLISIKPRELLQNLVASLPKFFEHCYKIHCQYTSMKILKNTLPVYCVVIHADFSENYALKYNKEVQSMHFGGSRKEVSLHTAVIYNFDFAISSIKATSMCTTSSCLRHDAPAVWAHIVPLIQRAILDNPFIEIIHFQTDSPTSQYRNKFIFYIITQLHKEFPQISSVTWNYTEGGHGKGAPDGVGAVIKRTLDSHVIHGGDVGTYEKFLQVVQKEIENVIVIDIPEDNIIEKGNILHETSIPMFRGTLAVHQVLWKKGIPNLTFRKVSCFECEPGSICTHDKHLGFLRLPPSDTAISPTSDSNVHVVPLIATKRPSNALVNITNRLDDRSASNFTTNISVAGPSNITILSNKRVRFNINKPRI